MYLFAFLATSLAFCDQPYCLCLSDIVMNMIVFSCLWDNSDYSSVGACVSCSGNRFSSTFSLDVLVTFLGRCDASREFCICDVAKLSLKDNKDSTGSEAMTEIFDDIDDRLRKKRNLVLSGVPESSDDDNGEKIGYSALKSWDPFVVMWKVLRRFIVYRQQRRRSSTSRESSLQKCRIPESHLARVETASENVNYKRVYGPLL